MDISIIHRDFSFSDMMGPVVIDFMSFSGKWAGDFFIPLIGVFQCWSDAFAICQCKLLFLWVLYSLLIIILVTSLQLRHAHLIEDNMWRMILISHPSSVAKSLFLDDLYLWMINLDPRLLIFPLLLPTDEKIGIWGYWDIC